MALEAVALAELGFGGMRALAMGRKQADTVAGEINRPGWLGRVGAQSLVLAWCQTAKIIRGLPRCVTVPFRVGL